MICHKTKTIFIHIPKTAGQSVEQYFINLRGLDWENRSSLLLRPCSDPRFGPERLAHLSAREYVECGHISQSDFQNYNKFTVIRNPWERIISLYNYLADPGVTLNMFFLNKVVPRIVAGDYFVQPQTSYLLDSEGNFLIKDILEFSNLKEEFPALLHKYSLPQMVLPYRNKSKSKNSSAIVTSTFIDHVAKYYMDDIEKFSYNPPLI